MSVKTIAVDIDDVLADSTEALRVFVNSRYGTDLKSHHYRVKHKVYWGYYEAVWKSHDIDGDGIIDEFHQQYTVNQSHVVPVVGSVEALSRLAERYRLIAVSARSADQQLATEAWIQDKFGDVFDSIACIDMRKNRALTKGQACRIAGAHYLVDDNVDHCISAVENSVEAILFGDYGWHDDENMPDGILKCSDWTDVLEYFDGVG